jgi:hypothetical protein
MHSSLYGMAVVLGSLSGHMTLSGHGISCPWAADGTGLFCIGPGRGGCSLGDAEPYIGFYALQQSCTPIAVSGQHPRVSGFALKMRGHSGAGTSLLARCLSTTLLAMTLAEVIETRRLHRVGGITREPTA